MSAPTTGGPAAAIDHILLGVGDLAAGCAAFEHRTGVRPVLGGEHPQWGTHNALVALGATSYLEIIALKPAAPATGPFAALRALNEPAPIGWCVAVRDGAATRAALRVGGFQPTVPVAGGRERPDGSRLKWASFSLEERPLLGAMPFFIEWAAGGSHPAVDSLPGCRLERMSLRTPEHEAVRRLCTLLALPVLVEAAEHQALEFEVETPLGRVLFNG